MMLARSLDGVIPARTRYRHHQAVPPMPSCSLTGLQGSLIRRLCSVLSYEIRSL
jgi:hypothetical protein